MNSREFLDYMRLRVLGDRFVRHTKVLKKYILGLRKSVRNWIAIQAARIRRPTLSRITFIGITGSCGKTTTTLLAGAILSATARCHVRAFASTEPTIAGTLLKVDPATRFCVHEVGAYKLGNIARSAGILRPHIGIVTTVGTDHYRVFRGLEGVAREKAALVRALPKSGTAILNADDPYVHAMASQTRARVVTYGFSDVADIKAADVSSVWPDRLSLTVIYSDERMRIQTKLVGEYWVSAVLAAIACGIACGIRLEDCAAAIEKFDPVFGRFSVHSKPGAPVYVLDTRKAPLWTIPYSVAFVERAYAPRKTIIFGTISDHPGKTGTRYRRVARQALDVADRVLFVGPNAFHVDKLRCEKTEHRLFSFPTAYQASQFLSGDALEDELILVKSSISDHLERIMLHRLDRVVCWKQPCRRDDNCHECPHYRTPRPPLEIASADLSQRSPTSQELH